MKQNTKVFETATDKDGNTILKCSCPKCQNVNAEFICPSDLSDDAFNNETIEIECIKCKNIYELNFKLKIEQIN